MLEDLVKRLHPAGTDALVSCVLIAQQTRLELIQRPRSGGATKSPDARATSGRRGSHQVLSVHTRDLDEICRYWMEEGMLIASPMSGTGVGRTSFGLDHDGYELRLVQVG